MQNKTNITREEQENKLSNCYTNLKLVGTIFQKFCNSPEQPKNSHYNCEKAARHLKNQLDECIRLSESINQARPGSGHSASV